jgi:hypothetical protein
MEHSGFHPMPLGSPTSPHQGLTSPTLRSNPSGSPTLRRSFASSESSLNLFEDDEIVFRLEPTCLESDKELESKTLELFDCT